MNDGFDLWTEATIDHEAEEHERSLTAARIEAADVWPFLAQAESETDWDNRVALSNPIFTKAASVVAPTVETPDALRERLVASLHDDWNLLVASHHTAVTLDDIRAAGSEWKQITWKISDGPNEGYEFSQKMMWRPGYDNEDGERFTSADSGMEVWLKPEDIISIGEPTGEPASTVRPTTGSRRPFGRSSKTAGSFYVRRYKPSGDPDDVHPERRPSEGWVGPIRSEQQAHKEKAAWEGAGHKAEVHPSSPEVKKRVRDWQRAADERRKNSSWQGERIAAGEPIVGQPAVCEREGCGHEISDHFNNGTKGCDKCSCSAFMNATTHHDGSLHTADSIKPVEHNEHFVFDGDTVLYHGKDEDAARAAYHQRRSHIKPEFKDRVTMHRVHRIASIQAEANQYIKQQGDQWVITQKGTGKVLSHHESKEKAEASFRAMMQSKHGELHTAIEEGGRTPWGAADGVYHLADGIDAVETPSHGGIKCDRARNAQVIKAIGDAGYAVDEVKQGYEGGWWEEDIGMNAVMFTFPEAFTGSSSPFPGLRGLPASEVKAKAEESMDRWFTRNGVDPRQASLHDGTWTDTELAGNWPKPKPKSPSTFTDVELEGDWPAMRKKTSAYEIQIGGRPVTQFMGRTFSSESDAQAWIDAMKPKWGAPYDLMEIVSVDGEPFDPSGGAWTASLHTALDQDFAKIAEGG